MHPFPGSFLFVCVAISLVDRSLSCEDTTGLRKQIGESLREYECRHEVHRKRAGNPSMVNVGLLHLFSSGDSLN